AIHKIWATLDSQRTSDAERLVERLSADLRDRVGELEDGYDTLSNKLGMASEEYAGADEMEAMRRTIARLETKLSRLATANDSTNNPQGRALNQQGQQVHQGVSSDQRGVQSQSRQNIEMPSRPRRIFDADDYDTIKQVQQGRRAAGFRITSCEPHDHYIYPSEEMIKKDPLLRNAGNMAEYILTVEAKAAKELKDLHIWSFYQQTTGHEYLKDLAYSLPEGIDWHYETLKVVYNLKAIHEKELQEASRTMPSTQVDIIRNWLATSVRSLEAAVNDTLLRMVVFVPWNHFSNSPDEYVRCVIYTSTFGAILLEKHGRTQEAAVAATAQALLGIESTARELEDACNTPGGAFDRARQWRPDNCMWNQIAEVRNVELRLERANPIFRGGKGIMAKHFSTLNFVNKIIPIFPLGLHKGHPFDIRQHVAGEEFELYGTTYDSIEDCFRHMCYLVIGNYGAANVYLNTGNPEHRRKIFEFHGNSALRTQLGVPASKYSYTLLSLAIEAKVQRSAEFVKRLWELSELRWDPIMQPGIHVPQVAYVDMNKEWGIGQNWTPAILASRRHILSDAGDHAQNAFGRTLSAWVAANTDGV
ncbi:MAG: hypothetical protein GY696_05730, partial [Gammaproteobacteria bacterium]|nr:hypothetical protein [Gammaproteobacteria bacterium]